MSLKVWNGSEWISTGIPGPRGVQGEQGLQGDTGLGYFGTTGWQGVTGPNAISMDYGVYTRRTTNQSIPDTSATSVSFTTTIRDDANFWSAGQPTRITVPETGWYNFGCYIIWDTFSSDGERVLDARINNSTWIGALSDIPYTSTGALRQAYNTNYYLTAGDYIEYVIYQSTGSSRNITEARSWCVRLSTGPQGATGLGSYGTTGFQGETGLSVVGETGSQGVTGPNALTMDYGAHVSRTTNQTISTGSFTPISFDTENRDDGEFWSAGQPTRITIPETGWYQIGGYIKWESNVTSTYLYIQLKINGSTDISSLTDNKGTLSATFRQSINETYYFTANDYVELECLQGTGDDLDIEQAFFWCVRLSTGPQGATGLGSYGTTGLQGATGLYEVGETGIQGVTGPNALTMDNGVRVSRSTAQSIPNDSYTSVIYTTEEQDDGGFWSASQPTRITIPETGWYIIGGQAYWANSSGGRVLRIYLDGSTILSTQTSIVNTSQKQDNISTSAYLSAGSYVEISIYQNSGSSLNLEGSNFWCNRISTGPKGETGIVGDTGLMGPQGDTGLQGVTGPIGNIMYGTDDPPSPTGLAEGTVYYQYVN